MNEAPRAMTDDEVREVFLAFLEEIVRAKQPGRTERERRVALVFAILTFLDGAHMHVPGWILAPNPWPADRRFHAANGENWWPENTRRKRLRAALAGHLHDDWAKRMFTRGDAPC